MKNVLSLIVLLLLASCNKGDEPAMPAQPERPSDDVYPEFVDVVPVSFGIDILDESGESIVADAEKYDIYGDGIYMIYDGKRYDLVRKGIGKSRFNMHEWYGIAVGPYFIGFIDGVCVDVRRLLIGEWSGYEDLEKSVVLVWNNGRREDVLSFVNKTTFDDKQGLIVDRHYYLNGDECPSGMITLRK